MTSLIISHINIAKYLLQNKCMVSYVDNNRGINCEGIVTSFTVTQGSNELKVMVTLEVENNYDEVKMIYVVTSLENIQLDRYLIDLIHKSLSR